ncbi:MAG TPA: glycosyltransferase [Thermoleophilaceae bacterium]|jgi:GT2 family glycosyltransferase/glycosyltransferase involved in cell wall biosynthesis
MRPRVQQLLSAARSLPRRAWLTLRYHGLGSFLFRAVTFPLRATPLGDRMGLGREPGELARARLWYRHRWRPVTVVIPTFGDPGQTIDTVRSVRGTTDGGRVSVVVADDGSPPADRERLRRELAGQAELVLSEDNVGFARNANRGLRAADPRHDVVLLNSDVVALPGWLDALQHAAYQSPDVGIVGPKLLYPDRTIQSAGSYRNLGAPEWFDHRYRFRPAGHGPANVGSGALAMTGACMYVKRTTIDRIGLLDERYEMAYEDVDWCLRAWEAGTRVHYEPPATLIHLESKTRGTGQGERELRSQRLFWDTWGDWFDARDVRAPDGRLRIVYVTEDTGVGGGHRVVFEHLNGLAARGHDCSLYTLSGPPDWFDLHVPVRSFASYDGLAAALAEKDAIKVATWWNTASAVWRASVTRGLPVYFVQDIETSYYPGQQSMHHAVLASYREEFRYLTTSNWVADRLRELNLSPSIVAPGVNLETFHDLGRERSERAVVSLGRSQPLKNLDLTLDAWRSMPNGRPELWLFGIEPELAEPHGARYFTAPSDREVNELLNTATALVQTSRHEGFCLPLLEAMAAGAPVVCTDAHGNRDFCRDGENCLMAEAEPAAVRSALERVLDDPELRRRLSEEGRRTAERYGWEGRIEELERFFESVAPPR